MTTLSWTAALSHLGGIDHLDHLSTSLLVVHAAMVLAARVLFTLVLDHRCRAFMTGMIGPATLLSRAIVKIEAARHVENTDQRPFHDISQEVCTIKPLYYTYGRHKRKARYQRL